jgi:hypothetical protein
MAINVTKPAINLREKLNEVTLETGIKGEELLNSDTSTEARNVLELDTHLFTDFESTGIDDNATSTAITIDASENVGIGTATPTAFLEVDNSTTAGKTNLKLTSSHGGSGSSWLLDLDQNVNSDGDGGMRIDCTRGTSGVSIIDCLTAGTSKFKVQGDGNVGIGTSSPNSELVVIGNIRTGSNTTPTSTIQNGTVLKSTQVLSTAGQSGGRGGAVELGGFYDNGVTTTTIFGAVAGLKEADASGVESGYLSLQTNSAGTIAERLRITSTGNVLVGTNADNGVDKLQVAGNIAVTGDVISSTGSAFSYAIGSDYIIHSDPYEISVLDTVDDADYLVMKTFVAVKSGQVRVRWEGYIQSGSYYWVGAFYNNGVLMKKSNNSTNATHRYNTSLASGFSSSVHGYTTFQMDLGDVSPGDVITYRMVSSTGPGTPVVGAGNQRLYCKNFGVYSTTPTVETHAPRSLAPFFTATGGTESTYSSGGTNYKVHTFTSSGTFTAEASGSIDYFIVAGGGGGGVLGGGGGAGGVLTSSQAVTAQGYSVVVGGGGINGSSGASGANGSNSSVFGNTALGGGGGGCHAGGDLGRPGVAGGSGGGGSDNNNLYGPGAGTSGQGFAGGNGSGHHSDAANRGGGGGGGASEAGKPYNDTSGGRGRGGNGVANSWLGTSYYFAGGGGRSDYNGSNGGGNGGLGGGGGGCSYNSAGRPGGAGYNAGGSGNTGANVAGGNGGQNSGGGAGANGWALGGGASGGSGIVIIRYAI